jgi:hypothetical protein
MSTVSRMVSSTQEPVKSLWEDPSAGTEDRTHLALPAAAGSHDQFALSSPPLIALEPQRPPTFRDQVVKPREALAQPCYQKSRSVMEISTEVSTILQEFPLAT